MEMAVAREYLLNAPRTLREARRDIRAAHR
jgi:hypothetical protein